MNIWIFNHYAVGPGSTGITRHYDLARELVKLGHKVTIFASSFNHQKRKEEQEYEDKSYYKKMSYEGVNFVWIKTPEYRKNDLKRVKNILRYTILLNKIYKKEKDRPEVIIGSLMHPLAAYLGYLAAKYYSAKFYFEERDLWPQSLIDLGKVSPKNPVVKGLSALELFLYKKADKIIVLFDKAPKYVLSRGIEKEKVIYLPNGVDISRYSTELSPCNVLIENYFEQQKGKFIIAYTGAHSVANYLEKVLEIAEGLKQDNDIHFLFVGDGPDKENLIKQADEKSLDNISFLPAVKKEEIPSILRKADAGIIALRDAEVYKWGISLNKMYDYMAAGLPIIMYTTLKDTIVEQHNLGIVNSNVENVISSIRKLKAHQVNLHKIKQNGLKYVQENHTWESLAYRLDCHLYD